MSAPVQERIVLGPRSAGMLLSPQEFDAIDEYDENYVYELIHGVLIVSPIPSPEETGPNDLLGYYLYTYRVSHPEGRALNTTLPQQYVRVRAGRRLADRLIWAGLGRDADVKVDVPSIGIEFVSAGRRNRRRDYVDKRTEYQEAGLKEYWIVDRFERTLTVVQFRGKKIVEKVVREGSGYESSLLPGFRLPLAELLRAADRFARRKRK